LSPVDLVIVEGFESRPHPKIEAYREANGKPLMFPGDSAMIGIATRRHRSNSMPVAHLDSLCFGERTLCRAGRGRA
jgi:molybdopterin-guanine dinucleotide biosynthesis protein B